jgi:hypothetical protein
MRDRPVEQIAFAQDRPLRQSAPRTIAAPPSSCIVNIPYRRSTMQRDWQEPYTGGAI